jgi:hypothetical protein
MFDQYTGTRISSGYMANRQANAIITDAILPSIFIRLLIRIERSVLIISKPIKTPTKYADKRHHGVI